MEGKRHGGNHSKPRRAGSRNVESTTGTVKTRTIEPRDIARACHVDL